MPQCVRICIMTYDWWWTCVFLSPLPFQVCMNTGHKDTCINFYVYFLHDGVPGGCEPAIGVTQNKRSPIWQLCRYCWYHRWHSCRVDVLTFSASAKNIPFWIRLWHRHRMWLANYFTVDFLQNTRSRHPKEGKIWRTFCEFKLWPAHSKHPDEGEYGVRFISSNYGLCFISVTDVWYSISCYNSPWYRGVNSSTSSDAYMCQ